MFTPLAILKICLIPFLIFLVSLITRRFGAIFGAAFSGLPLISAPISLYYIIEQGTQFGLEAAYGSFLGMITLVFYALSYCYISLKASLNFTLITTTFIWIILTALFNQFAGTSLWIIPLTVIIILFGIWLLPQPRPLKQLEKVKKAQMPYLQMLVGALMMVCMTALAHILPSNLSGMLLMFPVLAGILPYFALRDQGPGAVSIFFKGSLTGLLIGSAFFTTVLLLLPQYGTAPTYIAALAVSLFGSFISVWRIRYRLLHSHSTKNN